MRRCCDTALRRARSLRHRRPPRGHATSGPTALDIALSFPSVVDDDGAAEDIATPDRIERVVDVLEPNAGHGVPDLVLGGKGKHFGEVVVAAPEGAEVR